MKKFIFTFIAVLVVVSSIAMPVYAQATTSEEKETVTESPKSVIELDEFNTVKEYHFNGSTAVITIRTERKTRLKISDMFVQGTGAQQVPTKGMILSKGENTIRMDTTEYKGAQGVVVASPQGTIAITKKSDSVFSLGGNYSGGFAMFVGIAGIFVGVTVVTIASYKRELDISDNLEREL